VHAAYLAWQAFAVKVLVDGGRAQDSTVTRLLRKRRSDAVFALAHLYEVLATQPAARRSEPTCFDACATPLPKKAAVRTSKSSTIRTLMWFWNSNIRSTAITLGALIRNAPTICRHSTARAVAGGVEAKGRWGNTQENAWALEALVDYYRKFESVPRTLSGRRRSARRLLPTGIRRPFHGGVSPRRAACQRAETTPPDRRSLCDSKSRGPERSSTRRGCDTPSISCSRTISIRA
jgi:hypothetical protein